LWRLTFLEAQKSDEGTVPAGSWIISLSLRENSPPTHVKSVLSILEPTSSGPSSGRDNTVNLSTCYSHLKVHKKWAGGYEIRQPLGKVADKLESYVGADGNLHARLDAKLGNS